MSKPNIIDEMEVAYKKSTIYAKTMEAQMDEMAKAYRVFKAAIIKAIRKGCHNE